MRLIFSGTPEFAVPALDALAQAGHQIPLVITRPDRPSGRGLALTPPPVKIRARALGLEVIQPAKINQPEILARIADARADIAVVAAYAALIPKSLLNVPKHGWLNIHPSLLPKYRGASPVESALENDDPVTGVTIIRLEETLDTGPIILMEETPVSEEENAAQLSARLADIGARLIVSALALIESGQAEFLPQDNSAATYCGKFTKSDGVIDWSAANVAAHVRAVTPWPGARAAFHRRAEDKTVALFITGARRLQAKSAKAPGEIVEVRKDGIIAATGGGDVLLTLIKPDGKKEMPAAAFANGYRVSIGDFFTGPEK